MKNRWNAFVGVVALVAITYGAAFAGKGGGKPQEETLYEAGAVQFADGTSDAIISDGAAYIDGVDGVECVHSEPTITVDCNLGTQRSIFLSLGTCLSESCHDPFGGGWAGVPDLAHVDTDPFYIDGWQWPDSGETLVSNDSVYGGGALNVRFVVGTRLYNLHWRGPNGEIQATGYDDDGDGVRDRVVMSASTNATVVLVEHVTDPNAKKKWDRTRWIEVGEFTDMPFTVTFYSLGYDRTRPTDIPTE